MQILNGTKTAAEIRNEVAADAAALKAEKNITPCLAAVLVGNDPASQIYVGNKAKACQQAGIISRIIRLQETTVTSELLTLIRQLNADNDVHGILVQLPLPKGCDEQQVCDAVDPKKDVDAFHPENAGLISQGRPRFLPCTPHGIVQLLVRSGIEIAGKHVVVLGRSNIVGKPVGLMLVQKGKSADATVTFVHSRTKNLAETTRLADILIVAVGKAKFVTADMVKSGAVVIDVGINRTADGKICGDVDFDAVKSIVSAISPVPGGVGPLTIAMLLYNTVKAAKN
ncbi:MAG: bifunctional 5,10-methylene-tetrahydrofolate dehydrogenase/5,10-methylene-tetrahydrofolate cyclohydrolase [Planctomycetaceae bacterium]|jgi:methylenetetrahydrofolate dehydrogenase (NADP+)/methenyltetrahydrofolate cyclohydrolase|nr:bifunctional 5,10-methylene-tetrahydrofolate dehydrogenase/5,10-methylene-tetrahydrofolate cyclohydrolase [Planctomycetaceae bacterium]